MLNSFGKVFVVFVATASLAFAAFAAAMRNGGPNWSAEIDELGADFVLSVTPGDPVTYSLTHRRTNEAGKTSPVLAEVVTEARAKQLSVMRDHKDYGLTALTKQVEDLKPKTEAANAAVAADEKGLKAREEALVKQVNEISQAIAGINNDIIEKTGDAQKIRAEGQERREEVYRLKNQLELLRNDLYAAQVQRKNLEEEELRLNEILQRLERRQQQLSSSTGSNP